VANREKGYILELATTFENTAALSWVGGHVTEMSEQKNEAFFNRTFDSRFGTYSVSDERLHRSLWPSKPHYALSETQYLSFSIPEQRIHAFLHFWYHPNLKTICGGAVVFQGLRPVHLGVELYDYRAYMGDSVFAQDLDAFTFDNSYSVEMIEPGKQFRVRYDDPARHNRFNVLLTAVSEPMMWPDNRHFEQVMRTTGELVLRGKRHTVDGYSIRDRSWGEARMEVVMPGPSNSWAVGTFDQDFAFLATGTDHPDAQPLWAGKYDRAVTKSLAFGWVIHQGKRSPVIECRKRIHYDRITMMPTGIDMELTTGDGGNFRLEGTSVAGTPLPLWPNVRVPVCLIRWRYVERIGWGELQDAQWNDFIFDFAEQPG
jgi:hypothetical protein